MTTRELEALVDEVLQALASGRLDPLLAEDAEDAGGNDDMTLTEHLDRRYELNGLDETLEGLQVLTPLMQQAEVLAGA